MIKGIPTCAHAYVLCLCRILLLRTCIINLRSCDQVWLPLSVPPGVGVPYSLVAAFEDIKEALEKFIDISDDIKKALLISLVFLIIALVIILRYLKVIDELIEGCVEKSDEISMVEIDAGLLALQN